MQAGRRENGKEEEDVGLFDFETGCSELSGGGGRGGVVVWTLAGWASPHRRCQAHRGQLPVKGSRPRTTGLRANPPESPQNPHPDKTQTHTHTHTHTNIVIPFRPPTIRFVFFITD